MSQIAKRICAKIVRLMAFCAFDDILPKGTP